MLLVLIFSSLYSDFWTLNLILPSSQPLKEHLKHLSQNKVWWTVITREILRQICLLMYPLCCFSLSGEEGTRLHLRVGFRQRRAQQRPLLLRRLHQLHIHHLHLEHSWEWTQAVVPGGVLVHTDHHLQQRGELWPKDCKDWSVCLCVCGRFGGSAAERVHT